MKDFGKTISQTVGSPSSFQTEIATKDNSKQASMMDMGRSSGRMDFSTKDTGELEK